MRAIGLGELRDLVNSAGFREAVDRLGASRAACEAAAARLEVALARAHLAGANAELHHRRGFDVLEEADAVEDRAARDLAEASSFENESFGRVSRFEEQRFVASEAWYRLSALEKALEERREQLRSAAASSPARVEAEVQRLEREAAAAREVYGREHEKKQALWAEVEGLWTRSAELSLAMAERRIEAGRARRRAEALFARAEAGTAEADALCAEAEQLRRELEGARREAADRLAELTLRVEAAAVGDFLYFADADDVKAAFAVAVAGEQEAYGREVRPFEIFSVDRMRGVAALSPVPAPVAGAEPAEGSG